jgi:hypothetical protein
MHVVRGQAAQLNAICKTKREGTRYPPLSHVDSGWVMMRIAHCGSPSPQLLGRADCSEPSRISESETLCPHEMDAIRFEEGSACHCRERLSSSRQPTPRMQTDRPSCSANGQVAILHLTILSAVCWPSTP